MPAAATVDFRAPSDFTFDSTNFPASGTSGESCAFNAGSSFSAANRAGPTPSARPKARLFKQRRNSKSSSSSAAVDSGINPFRSVNSQNVDAPNCCNNSNVFGQFDTDLSFVFGVSISSNAFRDIETVDSEKNVSLQKEESNFTDHVGKPCFGEYYGAKDQTVNEDVECGKTGREYELSDGMKKLNIEHMQKGSFSEETVQVSNKIELSKDGESFFVFKSGEKTRDEYNESSVPLKGEENATNLSEKRHGVNDGKTSGFGSQSIDENIFVFVSSEVDGVKRDVSSSSFSLSSFGPQVDKEKPEVCSVSRESKVDFSSTRFSSSSEFKLPDFDFSLSNGLDTEEFGLRTRVSKGKKLRKTKAKSRQSKPTKKQPLQKPLSSQSIVQEDTPGCYSPMDFSPYEDSTSNNDVPLCGQRTTDQSKVKNGNSSVPYTESQPNPVFLRGGLGVGSSNSIARVGSNGAHQSCFGSNMATTVVEKFAFTASSSAQDHVLSLRCQHKKKYRLKTANASGTRGSSLGGTPLLSRLQRKGANFLSESKGNLQTEEDQEHGCESALSAAEKGCDKWRRRGNEAYGKGELSRAENFYTWGVNCIPPGDESSVSSRTLVRCYSNRAATRMALGMVREAIQDCLMAVKMDPTFHRAQMRAANCYLLLGELEDAMQWFGKSMESANAICLDRQFVISASDGIQKSQKVIECMNRCAELLKCRTPDTAASALELIAEAMSISLYSEKLLEMKAEALCMLGKHEEVITLCQQSLDFAEKNFTATAFAKHETASSCLDVRQWRRHISSKCHFHLGRLEVALELLEKQEFASKTQESSDPLAVAVRELLKQKSAGNSAFRSGKHAEAVEHYTSAILSSMESRPFAAICLCNRAAAHQALGQIADAVADCSLAISLDGNYAKAVSRRATLHEVIRDYKQAAADLQRLVSLLEKQSLGKSKQSGSGNGKELRQVQQHLSMTEEEAKRDVPLDLYLILGIKRSDSASEIKKAYRKAALRHHPDKAGQSLVRSDAGDEGRLWKDIAELVHKDSDRLFKMIGEAYAVLSDPTKREEYDDAEDMRKALKESNNLRSTSRRHSQSEYFNKGYPFERSSNRRYWQESHRTYSYRRW